jgi:truncated hemoglobin YjbI
MRVRRTYILMAIAAGVAGSACDSTDDMVTPMDAATPGTDAGTDGGTTLYERLGQHTGIRSALDAVVADELKDPEIASFFVLAGTPGHPTGAQITECLTSQLGAAAQGPGEAYPLTLPDGYVCRDMATIHAPFHISSVTFDKFVTIAAGTLTRLGVAAADIGTVGAVLNGTKPTIVDPASTSTSFTPPAAPTADAGAEAATTTLYERLGKHSGIRAAVDQIVVAELADPEIASFFVNQAGPKPGHPSGSQISECLTNQLGQAAGGPEMYPTTLDADAGGFVCRDMATIHAPFHIAGSTFDKFVMIAATKLISLGVAPADVSTVGAVLNSTKAAIVDPAATGGPFDAGAP